jgi:serine/threonine protein phosphatase PrpC
MTLGQKLFCVNVGDSRAIVCKITDEGLKTQAISRDQKPCQADEAARIVACGGRVDSFRDQNRQPIGPLRVWLKTEDIPGLAMTRSFGDEVASRVGVICEPGKNLNFFYFIRYRNFGARPRKGRQIYRVGK